MCILYEFLRIIRNFLVNFLFALIFVFVFFTLILFMNVLFSVVLLKINLLTYSVPTYLLSGLVCVCRHVCMHAHTHTVIMS